MFLLSRVHSPNCLNIVVRCARNADPKMRLTKKEKEVVSAGRKFHPEERNCFKTFDNLTNTSELSTIDITVIFVQVI